MISSSQKIFLLIGNVFPIAVAPKRRTDFNRAEWTKYDRIRELVVEAGRKVGVLGPESIDFRVSREIRRNACMVGSIASFGGPVMCLANDYFDRFEEPGISSHPDYSEWKEWLREIPDHPLEMARFLSQCSPAQRQRVHRLAERFQDVLTKEELQGIAAHEFGHAKHLHNWRKLFFTMPMSWAAYKVNLLAKPYLGPSAFLPALILFSFGMAQIQQIFEREADAETAVSRTFSSGLVSFFKKRTLIDLTGQGVSPLRAVEKALGFDFSTHPHPAKRVIEALERGKRPAQGISLWEKGMAFLGGLCLVREVSDIASVLWPKKKTRKSVI